MNDGASADRPAPAASGTLQKTPVLHLLVYALERNLTGTIEIATPAGETAAILFIDGQPSKARTSAAVAYLGRVLLELGHIDDDQLNKSLMQLSQTRRLHGQILLESGAIDEAKLQSALRLQLVQKLRHTFTMPPESTFAYYDSFDSLHDYGGDDILSLDPLPLVWAAVREAPPWEHVHAALTRVAQVALRVSNRAELSRFEFEKRELELIDLLRARPMRVSELAASELVKPREAQLLVYCLLITKQVQVMQEHASMPPPRLDPTPPSLSSGAGPPLSATTPARGNPAMTPAHGQPAMTPAHGNSVSFSLRAAVSTSPAFTPPPLPPRATPTAHRVMVKAPPLVKTPTPMLSPEALAALTPELVARREEILSRAETIDREDYFMMLDLDRAATPEAIREKFFALAKVWHPDRLPGQIADVRDACSRVFGRMSEAHQTLTDAVKRGRYMNLMTEGGATPEAQATIANVIEAATNFQKAEICMRRSDYVQAEALCRKAHEADPEQPDYLAMLAWLGALKAENQSPAATLEAVEKLGKAIATSNRCERAYFYRGQLHKRLGNVAMAAKDFRKAMELNPRNIDAAREVRLHEMRRERGSVAPPPAHGGGRGKDESPKPGLFGKLFKK